MHDLTLKEKIFYFLIGAWFVTLFLPDMPVLNNVVTGAILLHCLFFNNRVEKRQLFRERKEVGLMLLFYLWHIVSVLFSVNRDEGMRLLVLRLPLLIFPLSLGLIYIRPALRDRVLFLFFAIVTVTAGVCFADAFIRYRRLHDAQYLYDDNLTMILDMQSIYFALVVNLALFSIFWLLRRGVVKLRWLVWICVAGLLVFHFLLASRMAIIILYGSLLAYPVWYIVSRKKFVQGVMLACWLIIGAVLLAKAFPKTLNRFRELPYTQYAFNSQAVESHYNMRVTPDQWNGANIRLAIWRCGWDLVRQYPLTGVQLGDKQDRLMEVYRGRHFDFAYRSARNLHNTYLDVLVGFGAIGLLLFLAGWMALPLISAWRIRDGLGMLMIVAIGFPLFTESYFDRSIGCMLVAWFICWVVACRPTRYLSDKV